MSKTAVKLHPKLTKFKTAIEKRTSVRDVFVEASFKMDHIDTGSTVLNMLIGGSRLKDGSFLCPGWPRGKIVEIYGRESSGKTTIALHAMARGIFANGKNDGCGVYVDLETAIVDQYAMRLGVDFRSPELGGSGAAIRVQPHSFQETESIVMNAALNGVDVIVIDSVAALVSERETKRDVSNEKEKQGVAEVPRLMATWMPKLQRVITDTGTLVIFLNQTRDKIGAMGFSEEALKSTTGGNALKFFAAVRMMLKPKRSTKAKVWNPILKEKEDVQIATDVECKMIKNKIDAKQGHSGLVTLRYGIGVDELRTMMNVAEAYNIVKKTKNAKKQDVFKFKGEKGEIESIGVEKFRLALMAKPAIMAEFIELCQEKIVHGYRMIDDEQLAELAENSFSHSNDDDDDDYSDSGPPEETDGELIGDEGVEDVGTLVGAEDLEI